MTTLTPARSSAASRTAGVSLLGIGCATPPSVPQALCARIAADFSCETPAQRAWLERVFLRSGIDARGSVLAPHDNPSPDSIRTFYPPRDGPADRGPTTAVRMARYALEAPPLAHRAAADALAGAHTDPASITHLITVSCTGFFAPGLDSALIHSLSLRPTVHRLHVGFMGCHAAFNALAAARSIILAEPRAVVLVCCVELCTLHFAYGWDPGKLVANALFADGAAAAIVTAAPSERRATASTLQSPIADYQLPSPLTLLDAASCLLPNSAEAMTWNIGDHGFEMTLSPNVPALVGEHIRPFITSFLAAHHLGPADIARWAIHPGGPKVLSAIGETLGLPPAALGASRHILAGHGNMSSATILFILRHLAATTPAGPTLAIGLGPGLMAEAMLLE